jgi:biopolymer transport protein ExbD
MADIAFLLIIFFMVTTAYSLDRTPMELPQSVEQQQTAKGSALIAIDQGGSFKFSAGEADTEHAADLDELTARIQALTSKNRLHPFVVKADRRVKYSVIDGVLERLRAAGAENVAMLSVAEKGNGQ